MDILIIMVMVQMVAVLAYPEPQINALKITQTHPTMQNVPVRPKPPHPDAAIPPMGLVAHLDIVMQHLPEMLHMKHAMEKIQRVQEDDMYDDEDLSLAVQPMEERDHVKRLGDWGQSVPDGYYRHLENQKAIPESLPVYNELLSLYNEAIPVDHDALPVYNELLPVGENELYQQESLSAYDRLQQPKREHLGPQPKQALADLQRMHQQHIDFIEDTPLADLVPNLLSMEVISNPLSNPLPVTRTWKGVSGIGGRNPQSY